jgi:hypothetical protein
MGACAMLGKLTDLTLGSLSPEARTALWRAGITVAIVVHIAWACGLLPMLDGFAFAGDLEQAQAEIQAKLERLEESQNTLLRIALSQEICRIYSLRNASQGELQRQLQRSLVDKQDQYMAIVGERYPLSECAPGG